MSGSAPRWSAGTPAPARSTRRSSAARSTAPRPARRRRWTAPRPCSSPRRSARCPTRCAAALAAAGADCVVTDVGSTKRAVVEATDDERFIGGHPLAGRRDRRACEHARADLFDGATWYLTPTAAPAARSTSACTGCSAGLGARPAAIDAATHDRLLAIVSHLPHVLANVLVAQAAQALRGGERCPRPARASATSRASPAPTPTIWRDIYLANADALIAAIDDADGAARATSARALAAADGDAVAAWNDGARDDRRRLLEADLAGGEVARAARLGPQPPRRRRRGRARARPRRREHRPTWRSTRPPTARRATSSCGSPARSARPRPRALVAELGLPGRRAHEPDLPTRPPPLRGTLVPPPDKSLSHRAALLGAMSSVPVRVTNYLRPRTRSRRSTPWSRSAPTCATARAAATSSSTARACAARGRARRSTSATPARCCGCCPAGWPGSPRAGAGRSTATRASAAARSTASPAPLAAMGAQLDAREGRFTPLDDHRRGRCAGSSTRCPSPPPRSSRACCSPGCWPRGDDRRRARAQPRPHGAAARRAPAPACAATGDRITVAPATSSRLDALHVPGDPSSAAFHAAAAVLVPGSRSRVEGMAANWTRVGFFRILERMGATLARRASRPARRAARRRRAAVPSSRSRTARCAARA